MRVLNNIFAFLSSLYFAHWVKKTPHIAYLLWQKPTKWTVHIFLHIWKTQPSVHHVGGSACTRFYTRTFLVNQALSIFLGVMLLLLLWLYIKTVFKAFCVSKRSCAKSDTEHCLNWCHVGWGRRPQVWKWKTILGCEVRNNFTRPLYPAPHVCLRLASSSITHPTTQSNM